jgi:hypothetical protein
MRVELLSEYTSDESKGARKVENILLYRVCCCFMLLDSVNKARISSGASDMPFLAISGH